MYYYMLSYREERAYMLAKKHCNEQNQSLSPQCKLLLWFNTDKQKLQKYIPGLKEQCRLNSECADYEFTLLIQDKFNQCSLGNSLGCDELQKIRQLYLYSFGRTLIH